MTALAVSKSQNAGAAQVTNRDPPLSRPPGEASKSRRLAPSAGRARADGRPWPKRALDGAGIARIAREITDSDPGFWYRDRRAHRLAERFGQFGMAFQSINGWAEEFGVARSTMQDRLAKLPPRYAQIRVPGRGGGLAIVPLRRAVPGLSQLTLALALAHQHTARVSVAAGSMFLRERAHGRHRPDLAAVANWSAELTAAAAAADAELGDAMPRWPALPKPVALRCAQIIAAEMVPQKAGDPATTKGDSNTNLGVLASDQLPLEGAAQAEASSFRPLAGLIGAAASLQPGSAAPNPAPPPAPHAKPRAAPTGPKAGLQRVTAAKVAANHPPIDPAPPAIGDNVLRELLRNRRLMSDRTAREELEHRAGGGNRDRGMRRLIKLAGSPHGYLELQTPPPPAKRKAALARHHDPAELAASIARLNALGLRR